MTAPEAPVQFPYQPGKGLVWQERAVMLAQLGQLARDRGMRVEPAIRNDLIDLAVPDKGSIQFFVHPHDAFIKMYPHGASPEELFQTGKAMWAEALARTKEVVQQRAAAGR